jgi:hypothetical protein
MRRAALAAIALVVALILLLARSDRVRTARSDLNAPPEIELPQGASAPDTEPGAIPPTGATPEAPFETLAGGRVTDEEGKPLTGLRLLAIPRENVALWDAEDPFTPRGEAPAAPFAHSDADGVFAFRDLPRGDYRLAIDEDWMLEHPVVFTAHTTGLNVIAARAWCLKVQVSDLATSLSIPRFLVRYRWPPDAPEERTGTGTDGVFQVRLRGAPTRIRTGSGSIVASVVLNVEADGYHAGVVHVYNDRPRAFTWLPPRIEPLVTLRVQFEDGARCEDEASVWLESRDEHRFATLPAVRDSGGLYRVAVPPGSWFLEFRPVHAWVLRKSCVAKVEVAAGEQREVFLQMERGGEVVVRRRGWDGRPWLLVASESRDGVMLTNASMTVETAECVMRHIEPGQYLFRFLGTGPEPAWSRTVEVTTGSRHELTIE